MFKIVEKEHLNPTVSKMVIEAPFIARKAEPGQFIIFRTFEDSERIPLTIADTDKEAGTVPSRQEIPCATLLVLWAWQRIRMDSKRSAWLAAALDVPLHTR